MQINLRLNTTIRLLTMFVLASIISTGIYAQEVNQMHETAKAHIRQGEYANAITVLKKALAIEPANIELSKDLALSYYFINDQQSALSVIKPVVEMEEADEQSFQIAGNIYRNINDAKEAIRVYRRGLRKFPSSGPLYNSVGEVMWTQKDFEAIEEWEKGIEKDPSYSKNYYNAARFYFLSTDKIWSILYGEIFINMEPSSSKSHEIKEMLLHSYKKLYLQQELPKENEYNRFENAFMQNMNKQAPIAASGITPETLTMIRTRFILDWFNEKRQNYKLFEYQKQLLQEGLFDAYNQWLFGSTQNLGSFQNWITSHPDEYAAFSAFQKTRIFKIPQGQYYQ